MPLQTASLRFIAAPLLGGTIALAGGCDHGAAKTKRGKSSIRRAHTIPATQRAAAPAEVSVGVERPLFERLGGTAGVTKVVDDFVALAAADPKVNFTRKGHPAEWNATPQNLAALKKRLIEFVATTTGGDLAYQGKDMVTAHKGMDVTDAEFDALAGDLKAVLDTHDVPAREQAELLAVVNRTRSAIVPEPKSPATPDGDVNPKTPSGAQDVQGAAPKQSADTPKAVETLSPFVPQPVTSNETELEEEDPATAGPKRLAPLGLNK